LTHCKLIADLKIGLIHALRSGGDKRHQTIAGRMFSGLNLLKKVGAYKNKGRQNACLTINKLNKKSD